MSGEIQAIAEMMRAVVIRVPGGPEQLEIREVSAPPLVPGSIDIDVQACALNRADLLQRRGAYPPPPGASEILGLECAGVVRRVGPGVADFAPGDRVMALLAGGGYAERVVVPAAHALPIPPNLSFVEGAAIPEAFLTANEALFSLGRLEATSTVLIHAAAGGVGAAAVQLAKLAGARVIASVGSQAKVEWVRALGADAVLNYREVDFAGICHEQTDGRGVDVILDFIGASAASRHQRCLAQAGRWVMIGLLGGTRAELDLGVFVRRRLQLLGLIMRTRTLAEKSAIVARFGTRGLDHLRDGTLRPTIDRVYPLEQAAAAHERMERNENLGKIVLSIADGSR